MTVPLPTAGPSRNSEGNTALMVTGCCVALASLAPVALYQVGALGHLPDPPMKIFDSDAITSSRRAHPFGVPDALLGMASFSATLALVVAARRRPTARRLLAAKLAMDSAAAAFNAVRQVVAFGKLCSWCMITALAAGVTAYGGREVLQAAYDEAKTIVESEAFVG